MSDYIVLIIGVGLGAFVVYEIYTSEQPKPKKHKENKDTPKKLAEQKTQSKDHGRNPRKPVDNVDDVHPSVEAANRMQKVRDRNNMWKDHFKQLQAKYLATKKNMGESITNAKAQEKQKLREGMQQAIDDFKERRARAQADMNQ